MDKHGLFHLSMLEKKYSAVLAQIEKLQDDKQKLELHTIELEKQLQQRLRDHENDVVRASKENDKLLTENLDLFHKLSKTSQNSDETVSRYASELDSVCARYSDLVKIHDRDQRTIQDLQARLECCEQELDSKTNTLNQYLLLNATLEKAKSKAVKDLKALQKSYTRLKNQTSEQNEQMAKHMNKVKNKEEDARNLIEDYRSALKRMKMLQEENSKITADYSAMLYDSKSKEERLNALRTAKKKLEVKLKDLEDCYVKLNCELEIYKDKINEYAKVKGDCNNHAHIEIDAKLMQNEVKTKLLASKIEPLLARNRELEEALHTRDSEIRHLKEVQKMLNDTLSSRSAADDPPEALSTMITPRSEASDQPRSILKSSSSLSPRPAISPRTISNQAAFLASRKGKDFIPSLSSLRARGSDLSSFERMTPLSLNLDKIYQEESISQEVISP